MIRIGIDLGGTKTEAVLMDAQGEIQQRLRKPTPATAGYDAIITNLVDTINELESLAGETCKIGIGTPGSLAPGSDLLRNSNTVCLNNRPFKRDLEARLGRAIRMANDANCFALSEAIDGAGAGFGTVFGVIMGTGVGGGIVVNQGLIEGKQHIAGEWGHNPLDPAGADCYCGRRGCVETCLSGPGLVQAYQRAGGKADAGGRDIVAAARAGEQLATRVFEQYLENFGRALATVINILDPDVVVLGGGMSGIDELYDKGKMAVARHVFNAPLLTPILQNQHGDSSGVRGAAWLWSPDE
ncbi:MAG: ROK family protein [Acidiferrobacterales bacterium]